MRSRPRAAKTKRSAASGGKRIPARDAEPDGVAARLEAAIEGLRAEIASLPAFILRPQVSPASSPDLGTLAGHLQQSVELLIASLGEVPKAQDFQPLADHLYAFAEGMPRLMESLEMVRQAVGALEGAARGLAEVAETLLATQQSWSESLLRLPRAEDYEPLAGPLREFARVSPTLADTLGSVVRAVAPLPAVVSHLSETADKLRALPSGLPIGPGAADPLARALGEAADRLGAGREVIQEALDTLPRDSAYAKFAAQLRELASVSPSLMDWLRQVPALTLPLGEAVASLGQVAQDLADAELAARRVLSESRLNRGG